MKKLNKLLFIAAIALIFLLQQPVISTTNNQTILEIEQKAEQLYKVNQYAKAINLLKTTIKQWFGQNLISNETMGVLALFKIKTNNEKLNRIGKYQSAQTTLKSGMAIAEKLADNLTMAEIYLNLGNNARLQSQTSVALNYYQQAIKIAPQPDLQLRGKLEQLGVLVSLPDSQTASNLVTEIQQLLGQLPIQQTTIQAQISLARYLLDLNTPPGQIAELLVQAVKQAKIYFSRQLAVIRSSKQ